MFGNLLNFALTIKAIDQASRVIKGVQEHVENLNASVKATGAMREYAQNLAMVGAGFGAAGAAGLYAIKEAIEPLMELDAAQRHLLTALPAGAEGMRQMRAATEAAAAASIKFNVSQEDYLQNVYLGVSAGLSFNAAIANATDSIEVAKGTMGDAAETGRILGQVYNDFGDTTRAAGPQVQHFADVVAYAVRQFAFKNVGEFNEALKESIGAAKAAGLSFEETTALVAGFQKVGITGSEAGSAIQEMMQAIARGGFEKLGVPLERFNNGAIDVIGTLTNFKRAMGDGVITAEQFQRVSKALGVRGSRLLTLDPAQLAAMHDLLTSSTVVGAAAQGAQIVSAGAIEQLGRLSQAWTQLREAFGQPIFNSMGPWIADLVGAVKWVIQLAKAHPEVVKMVALFTAFASVAAVLVGGLLVVGAALAAAASFGVALGPAIATIATIVVGIGAIGTAAVMVGPRLYRAFEAQMKRLEALGFGSGTAFVLAIAHGITAVGAKVYDALASVLHDARKLLPFSPAKEGPLRDLHRVRIVQTIAEQIRPAPAVLAMRRVAAAVAIAAVPTFAAAPTFALGTAPRAGSVAAAGGATMNITVNAPVTIHHAGSEQDLGRALEQHRRKIARLVADEVATRNRTRF